jgi:hypothetical protein
MFAYQFFRLAVLFAAVVLAAARATSDRLMSRGSLPALLPITTNVDPLGAARPSTGNPDGTPGNGLRELQPQDSKEVLRYKFRSTPVCEGPSR